jgi:CubicO group peptidase (beta-lactamase class C family)
MRFVSLYGFFSAVTLLASDAYPPPRFTDPERVGKSESAMPEVDRIFRRYATEHRIPGMVWGVAIDARLAYVESAGVQDRSFGSPITEGTVSRIASNDKELHRSRHSRVAR